MFSQLDSLGEQLGEEFKRIDNPEMMTFRMPTLLEYLMVFLLAKRLGVEERNLPNLDYGDLTQTALAGGTYDKLREKVLKLGEVRNQLAHYVDRNAWTRKVEEFLELMELPRPPDGDVLMLVYQLGLSDIYAELFLAINNFLGGDELREQAAAVEAFRTAKRDMLRGVMEQKEPR